MKLLLKLFIFLSLTLLNNNSFSQVYYLKISSKDSVENNILKDIKFNKSKIHINQINKQINSIHKQFNNLGFLNYKLESKIKKDSIFNYTYSLNKQVKTAFITFNLEELYIKEFINLYKIEKLDNSLKLQFNELDDFMNNLLVFYEEKGYSFIKAKLTDNKIKNENLYSKLDISKNSSRRIDKIIIEGYNKFPNSYIKNYYLERNKNIFNKNILQKIYYDTNYIPFISQTKKPQVLFNKDSTLIYIYLKKKKTNLFNGLIGFSTNKNSKLQLNGNLNLKLYNSFNKGEVINLFWESSKENMQLDLLVDIPYIFNSRINPTAKLNIFKKDSSYVNIKFKSIINYQLNNRNKIGVIGEFEKSNIILKSENINYQDYTNNLYGINYKFNKPYNSVFYKNKYLINFNILIGKKNYQYKKYNNKKIQLNMNYLISINNKNYIYLNNTTSVIISNNILDNELLKVGDINILRGFKKNSILASKYSIFNIEYNYKLNKKTNIYTISDLGSFYYKKHNNIYSFGLGYKTKIKSSIININYSFGIINKEFNIKNAILNISFSNYF